MLQFQILLSKCSTRHLQVSISARVWTWPAPRGSRPRVGHENGKDSGTLKS